MSLASMLLDGFHLDPMLYKCPDIPKYRPIGIPRPYWGVWFMITGVITLALYIPCIIAIASHDNMKSAAYKTMLVLGIYDISSTMVHSLATGFLGYYGITFCDYPRVIFTLGAVGMGSWMGCCITSMVLALIRICDINPQLKLRVLFKGLKIYFWLFVFWLYGFYAGLFTKPIIFNLTYMSWFFDPGLGGKPENFVNMAHTSNNVVVAICTSMFYSYLCHLVLTVKSNMGGSMESTKLTRTQITIMLQTFLFCIFHTIAAALYAYMQFFSAPEYLILTGQITWQLTSLSICLVYLTLNRTIQQSVKHMVCPFIKDKQNQVAPMQRGSFSQTGL